MPFYDLSCKACGQAFNILATVADKEEQNIACPTCGAHDLTQLFTAAHFQMKKSEAPACPNSHVCGADCHHLH